MSGVLDAQLSDETVDRDNLYGKLLSGTQQLATLLDGISRHTPEGHNFKKRVEEQGWKQAVQERDKGTFDWSKNKPIQENGH